MTAAFSFDGHHFKSEHPIGIEVATQEFIQAHFRFGKQEKYYCVCPDTEAFALYKEYGAAENIKPECCVPINQNDPLLLEESQCLVRYDPGIVKNSWIRRYHGQQLFSLCGVAHACASENIMEMLGSYVTAPLQDWDALICPSNTIRSSILSILDGWSEIMKERYGTDISCPLEFPIIPIGVNAPKLAKLNSEEIRLKQRTALAINKNEIVILYVGRLNYLTKANPIPLLIAAEEVAKNSVNPLRIIFHGYYNDEINEPAFNQAINSLCENVTVTYIRHGDQRFPDGVWAASDIFCSLSDNIQESFGITPLEAMAVGLPVIVSDWNGYRETVRNGIEGITIPTYMPISGTGSDIAYKYFVGQFSYGDYLGSISQSTCVDVTALGDAIHILSADPEKRTKMGNAGKARVADVFDWSRIIPAYEDLWNEQNLRRLSAGSSLADSKTKTFHPSRPDPFLMFEGFPTGEISLEGRVSIGLSNWDIALERIKLKMGLIIPVTLMEIGEIAALTAEIESQPNVSLATIASTTKAKDIPSFIRTVGWLCKLGICRYHPP